jgi:hypothetical protein
MSVPLDNLYHWVEGLLPGPAIVYVFQPPGSKNISDLIWLKDYDQDTVWKFPGIIMHDQEPLDWNFYNQSEQYLQCWGKINLSPFDDLAFRYLAGFNLKSSIFRNSVIYDQTILVHSEKNSVDLEHYEKNEFLCVHYWAHAIIARDWYRFAEYDTRLQTDTKSQSKFLIYCRDWSHRREYRLKFLEMLIENSLDHDSQTSVMHTNGDNVHFSDYEFLNPKFKLKNSVLIGQLPDNTFSSRSSAGYDPDDFVTSEISVVLETVFDDSRIHLTEKTLRPIACGHPFMLAAGPRSLEYIRSYGFKTFAPWIDESYDQETDSLKRLEKIIQSMKQIQQLHGQEQENFISEIKKIAEFNQKHFFSNEFFNQVTNELKNNLNLAMQHVVKSQGTHYLKLLGLIKKNKMLHKADIQWRQRMTKLLRQLQRSYPRDLSSPQEDPPA